MNKQALFRIYRTILRKKHKKKTDQLVSQPVPIGRTFRRDKEIVVLSGRQLALIEEITSTC